MYRRPKSLEVLLDIRAAMSEEAGHDIPTFVEIVRTGAQAPTPRRTVTRVEGSLADDPRPNITTTAIEAEALKNSGV